MVDRSATEHFSIFFVLGAAAETVFCSAFLDRMRLRDFRQRMEIEAARNETP